MTNSSQANGNGSGTLSETQHIAFNEEADVEQYDEYLRGLPPEALWDVLGHIDPEQFPRRHERIRREISRRRLLFVSPYSAAELRLRSIVGSCFGCAALAASLRAVGSYQIQIEPWQHLSWFYDLAVGGPPAARMILPFVRLLACCGLIVAFTCVISAVVGVFRHRTRGDLAAIITVAAMLAVPLTLLSF